MRLYPDAFREFVSESGRVRTPASERSFRGVLAALHADNPTLPVSRYTGEILTRYCLKGDVAPNTIKHRRAVIRTFFEWATWKGHCKTDPSIELKFTVSPGRHKVREGHWLSEHQIAQVIRACPDTFQGRRDRIILMVGFMLGLRLSSIAKLEWTHFNDDLSVLEATVKGQKRTRKGVPAQLRQELLTWRQGAPVDAVAVIPQMSLIRHGLEMDLIVHWDRPLGSAGIRKLVKLAGDRCGIELTPHDMRRSMAGVMESKGADVMKIRRALDHTNVGTTSIYLDQNPNRTQEATEGLTLEL